MYFNSFTKKREVNTKNPLVGDFLYFGAASQILIENLRFSYALNRTYIFTLSRFSDSN